MNLRRILSALAFVNTHYFEERIRVLFSEKKKINKKLSKIPGNSHSTFKKPIIECYAERSILCIYHSLVSGNMILPTDYFNTSIHFTVSL